MIFDNFGERAERTHNVKMLNSGRGAEGELEAKVLCLHPLFTYFGSLLSLCCALHSARQKQLKIYVLDNLGILLKRYKANISFITAHFVISLGIKRCSENQGGCAPATAVAMAPALSRMGKGRKWNKEKKHKLGNSRAAQSFE